MGESTVAPSQTKKARLSWFEELVAWVHQSPHGFVAEQTVALDSNRTLRTIKHVAEGEILFRVPTITSGMTDAHLAWYLATRRASIHPYLASLPSDASLPRDNPDLDELLTGSPVLRHLQQSRQTVRNAYDTLSKEEKSATKISWDDFRSSYNTVTSRAFDGPMMVPLLDLCDHVRGSQHKKNVSYTFLLGDDDVTIAIARAAVPIAAGAVLTITYGAQPNSQLYVNYGFCVCDNFEPDGSSNDVLEWAEGILLRIGPRSYTYGPLVKALELVAVGDAADATGNAGRQGDDDSMDDFLNECEAEDDETDDFADCYGTVDDRPSDTESEDKDEELRVIHLLYKQLVVRSAKYDMSKTQVTLEQAQEPTPQFVQYTAMLLRSELQILQFYVTTLCKIVQLLASDVDSKLQLISFVELDQSEQSLVDQQAQDLCDAYMQIRHPELPHT